MKRNQKENTLIEFKEYNKSLTSKKAIEIAVLNDISKSAEDYNITFDINEEDINQIFDFIYSYLQGQNRVEEYYSLTSLIMKTVLKDAISNKKNVITLENFISSFKLLILSGIIYNYIYIDILFKQIEMFIREQETLDKKTTQVGETQGKIIKLDFSDQNKNP